MMDDVVKDPAGSRLDNFVDGAFAFALTLLVIVGGEPSYSYSELMEGIRRIPAFAAGFSLIGVFWFAHVTWRRAGGRNDVLSIVLSLALVFAVLVYVYPLRLMVFAFTEFLAGREAVPGVALSGLFTIYGLGFTAMGGLVWGLYAHGQRAGHLSPEYSATPASWATVALTGIVSVLLAQFHGTVLLAPWVYVLLFSIPLVLHYRSRRRSAIAAD